MKSSHLCTIVLLTLILVSATPVSAIDSPETFFGFQPGSDRELIDYEELIAYLKLLDTASDRLQLSEVGASPQGRPMYVAFISSAENIAALERLREINRSLALDPDLDEATRSVLVEEGRVFVMATLSMHSSEVAPSQSLPILAHELVTTSDEVLLERLQKVVMMVVPNHNPDGMDMIVHHYRKHKGTKYEGSSLPGIYHQYAGHDNNRDFVNLSQADTRVINRLYSLDWLPQVLVEKHQMGLTGPRYFVPPNHDPISENIDEALWLWSGVFGTNMARDMGEDGHSGVAQHWMFDDYWPGSTETSLWKNVISFLTEAASCKTAKPVFVEPTELSVRGKGLAEYKKSVNMPEPWPGGWWRLGDIVAYELSSFHSVLKTAARHDKEILRFRNDICRKEVAKGRNQAPYYFVLPARQHDSSALLGLVALLEEHGVKLKRLIADTQVDGRAFAAGDLVVPLSQPFRAFVKEVMEVQHFPVRHYTPSGEMIRPYDITSWSLPLHRGVTSLQVDTRSTELEAQLEDVNAADLSASIGELPKSTKALAYPASDNESFRAAFVALGKGLKVDRLEYDTSIDGQLLAAGSFLIRGGHGKLGDLAEEMAIAPRVIHRQPDTATVALALPKIALVETWFHDMDAGWTRFVLDSYSIPYQVLRPVDLKEADLGGFDVVVLPDSDSGVLKEGRYKRANRYFTPDYPPEYSKGMGDKGLQNLLSFLENGGIIVSWRQSTALFMEGLKLDKPNSDKDKDEEEADSEQFRLPIRDITESCEQLYVPGTFLAIDLLPNHPLTWGMPERSGVFSRGKPVLQTSIPSLDMDRRVVAAFPKDDILLSGFAEGEEGLANTPAMVWISKGKGQLVLLSFNPQFRASTPATYKLLFNALLLP